MSAAAAPPRGEKQKMLSGEYYQLDAEILADCAAAQRFMVKYNSMLAASAEERHAVLKERFAAVGEGASIRPPFHCDFGSHISLGANSCLNYNCVILDVAAVTIGAGTFIGPGVQILTADHPRDAAVRATGAEFGRPISIGNNVWIGGGAIILPGVTIGDDAIIGAGAVVTKNVPAGVTAVGNPARVLPPKTSSSDATKDNDDQQ